MRCSVLRILPFLFLLLALSPAITVAQPYTLLEIGMPPEFVTVEPIPTAINNRQQVVGFLRPCDECGNNRRNEFLWDPATGLRLLNLNTFSIGYLGIDDAGVISFTRCADGACRPFKWVDAVVSALPMPPGAASASIWKVLRNGTVLMSSVQTDGRRTLWALDRGSFSDLEAVSGSKIWTMNEQATLGGCTSLDGQGRTGRPYLRLPDGRVIQPWQTPCQGFGDGLRQGVSLISRTGHFAGISQVQNSAPVVPDDWYAYYAAPDGRMWTTGARPSPVYFADMNGDGTLVGWIEDGDRFAFTFREGRLTDLRRATPNWPAFRQCHFQPSAINDAGYIAGGYCGAVALLVPGAPAPPASLSFTITGRIVTLAWRASAGASDYIMEVGSAPGLTNLYSASLGEQLSLSATAPPGRFYVRIRARSAGGVSAASNEVVIDVP